MSASKAFLEPIGRTRKISICRQTVLGQGNDGTVVFEGSMERRIPVAVKRCQLHAKTNLNALINELAVLMKLDHPNVIRYKLFDRDQDFTYIALDLCRETLADWLKTTSPTESERLFAVGSVAKGLQYLHSKSIIHSDLKPQNVLLQEDKGSRHGFRVVISDFGLSVEVPPDQTSVTAKIGGSSGWLPREVIEAKKVGQKIKMKKEVDIFSFGCLLQFVMATKRKTDQLIHPFGASVSRDRNIHFRHRVAYLVKRKVKKISITDLLADILIELCVSHITDNRPTAEEIISNPLFWDPTKALQFLMAVFNHSKIFIHDKSSEMNQLVNSVEETWAIYLQSSLEALIPEAWNYTVMCRKESKASKPKGASLFNMVLRIVRNTHQHANERVREFAPLMKALGSNPSEEAVAKYFLDRLPTLIPIVYYKLHSYAVDRALFPAYYLADKRPRDRTRKQSAPDQRSVPPSTTRQEQAMAIVLDHVYGFDRAAAVRSRSKCKSG